MKADNDLKASFKLTDTRSRHLQDRISAQLSFAEWLCAQNKKNARRWQRLIATARDTVAQAAGSGDLKRLTAAVRAAEKIMQPLAKAARSYTLYLVGHAHIDMNWMWSWPETVGLTTDTFATVLKLMKEFPFFKFSQSQASVYRIVEEHDPAMLKRIKKRVKEGRWEVTASHWVEGDKNLAGGESLCRHLLYTRKYMQQLFGLTPEDIPVDWAPDTFGHAATVPSYLVRGGVKYTYMHRPGAHTPPQPRPRAFRWQAPDKSEVLVHNDMHLGYNGAINSGMVPAALQAFSDETGLKYGVFVYGVGDHGGGPTRRDLQVLEDMMTWPIYPRLKPAGIGEYFRKLDKDQRSLPLIADELNFEFTGCYTTQALVKRANRLGENILQDAEAACAAAQALTGLTYPASRFEEGWRDTLFNHFHDILPGSGVQATRTYTHGLFQKTAAMTSMEEKKALRALAAKIDTSAAAGDVPASLPADTYPRAMGAGIGLNTGEGGLSQYGPVCGSDDRPYVIFNPLGLARDEVIEALVWDPAWGIEDDTQDFQVTGPDGAAAAAQVVDRGHYWGHDFVRLAFPVSVPGLGYALYTVSRGTGEATDKVAASTGNKHVCGYAWYERGGEGLQNGFTKLEIDMETGGIKSLVDTRTWITLVEDAPVLQYGLERPRGMSAWVIEHTDGWEHLQLLGIERGLDGPYTASLRVKLRVNTSDMQIEYRLKAGDPAVHITITGIWNERGTSEKGTPALRLSLPLSLAKPQAVYEIPFGAVERSMPGAEEVPALNWAAVYGQVGKKEAGCLLLNDCKHGHSLDGNALNLTLIRSSYSPDPMPESGEHTMRLALVPIEGTPDIPAAIHTGKAFNHALRVVPTDAHKGKLGAALGLLAISPRTVYLESVKRAEDSKAFILRLVNTNTRNVTAQVKLDKAAGKGLKARTVDILERPDKKNGATVEGRTVSVPVPGRGIVTIKISSKD